MFFRGASSPLMRKARRSEHLAEDGIAATRELGTNSSKDKGMLDAEKCWVVHPQPRHLFIAPDGELTRPPTQVRHSLVGFFASLQSIHGENQPHFTLREGDVVIAGGQVTYYRQLKDGKTTAARGRLDRFPAQRENENGCTVFRHAHWPWRLILKWGGAVGERSYREQITYLPMHRRSL